MHDRALSRRDRAGSSRAALIEDDRGAVMVEYVVILGLVSIGVALAIVGLGPHLVASFLHARGILIAPMP